jgi:hypothetical protein
MMIGRYILLIGGFGDVGAYKDKFKSSPCGTSQLALPNNVII